jgi:hypothetical protein
MRSNHGKDGFVVETRSPHFKAWGNLYKLKEMAERKWLYVTLADQAEYGSTVGIVYLSWTGAFFYIRPKQGGVPLMGRTRSLRAFLGGKRNRASLHLRLGQPPKAPPLVLEVRRRNSKDRRVFYWVGNKGSRYGVSLTHPQLVALRDAVKAPRIREPICVWNVLVKPLPDGTVEMGKGPQPKRPLRTTAQALYDLLDRQFITVRYEKEWFTIPKPPGWRMDPGSKYPIVLLKEGGGPLAARMTIRIRPRGGDMMGYGGAAIIPLDREHELAVFAEGRWAKREVAQMSRAAAPPA